MKRKKRDNGIDKSKLVKTGIVLSEIGRILLACIFIFSGFVKAIDPLGNSYKFQDYFEAFGGLSLALIPLSFTAAIALSTLELVLGFTMLFKIKVRQTTFLMLLFMIVMTPLTLYIALENPVSDCGCFGEALKISNWATFYKNIVISAVIIGLLIFKRKHHSVFLPRIEWVAISMFILLGCGLSIISIRHLPMIDFLPYKVGVNIPAAMKIPEGAPHDVYSTTFIYQKNGQKKEFTLQNYPKNDSTWTFVDQKTVLISKGYVPEIHDFSITNSQMEDLTNEVLDRKGHSYLLIMYDLSKTSEEGAKKAEVIYQQALKNGVPFYALTASSDDLVKSFKKRNGVTYPFYKTDPTTLKTVIRANPGLVLINNGTIEGKWNWRDFLSN